MARYIELDAVMAEIERRIESCAKQREDMLNVQCHTLADDASARMGELNCLQDFIGTLEVKDDNLLTEKKIEKELAEAYISIFDKKFGNKLPKLKGKRLADFKNFINTCEQTFHIKYFDYHATQGRLFEKLALLWAVWGQEHLTLEGKEVETKDTDIEKEIDEVFFENTLGHATEKLTHKRLSIIAKHFYELGLKAQKGE